MTMDVKRIATITLALGLGAAACADEPVLRATDEAGVEVVTVNRAAGSFDAVGTVDPEPELELASMDDDPSSVFRSVSAVRSFPDGSFLVADGQSGELALFEEGGAPIRIIGGQGERAGAFRTLSSIPMVTADSIWAWDEPSSRVTVLTRDGEVARTVQVVPVGVEPIYRVQVLPDRRILGVWEERSQSVAPSSEDRSLQRDTLRFDLYDAEGGYVERVLSMPGRESMQMWQGGGDNSVVGVTARLPFGRDAAYAVVGDRVVGGPNDRFELGWWEIDGERVRSTRFTGHDEPLSSSEVDAVRTRQIEEAGDIPERVEHIDRTLDSTALPDTRPAFERILTSTDGRVWVKELDTEPAAPSRWWVFDAEDGAPLGYVELPAGLEVHEIGPAHVLGVYRDEMSLLHVRRHALEMQDG